MPEINNNLLSLLGADIVDRWNLDAPLGTPVTVTYNFPQTRQPYDGDTSAFGAILPAQYSYFDQAMDLWSAASGINFVRVPNEERAEVTFSLVDMAGRVNSVGNQLSGFGYYPSDRQIIVDGNVIDYNYMGGIGGDIFLNLNYYGSVAGTMAPGQRGYSILIHEIGHALGLEHPFEGEITIDPNYDYGAFTVMSYDRPHSTTTLGTLDVEATQIQYGPNVAMTAYWDSGLGALVQETTNNVTTLLGNTVAEVMRGGDTDDTFYRAGAGDTIDGGDGEDIVHLQEWYYDGMLTFVDDGVEIELSDGTVYLSNVESAQFFNAEVSTEAPPNPGVNLSNLGSDLPVTLVGAERDDTLTGGEGDDVLAGQDGVDLIYGGGGNDTMSGSGGRDYLEGQAGDDLLGGGLGRDALFGGDGNDTLGGGRDDDTLMGGADDDIIASGEGDDEAFGDGGHDNMAGSYGGDTLDGGEGNDSMGGGTGRDSMNGGLGDDELGGGEGDDTVSGDDGNDFLAGGGRQDIIDGGIGDDSLNGGTGNDTLTGGSGADLFIFNALIDGEADIITDFEIGTDTIRLRGVDNEGSGRFAALDLDDVGADAVITYNGHTIRLLGIDPDDLTSSDFLFI